MWTLFLLISTSLFAEIRPLDAELNDFPYFSKVQYKEFLYKDVPLKIAYMDEGPEKPNGETVVLLHGKNFSGGYWEKTANDLELKGYRVIIPDQIGFGKSSKPANFPFTFQYLSKLTMSILEEKKIQKFILVGHSMGGMLATRMALMYPEQITKLVLINPIGLEDWKLSIPYKSVPELYQMELKSTEENIRKYQKESYFDGKWKPEYEKGIEILAGWTKHAEYPKVAWNAALTTDMVFTQPVVYEFQNLKVPTLLIIGTRDRTVVGKGWASDSAKSELGRYDLLGKKIVKEIPNGKLVEISDVGHMPQVEAYPVYWKALFDFIKN